MYARDDLTASTGIRAPDGTAQLAVPSRVVVVGAGLTGLSAAYHLQQLALSEGNTLEVTLVEAQQRVGGVIHTLHDAGHVIERGPDSFLAGRPAMMGLVESLGLSDQLVRSQPLATYVLRDGRLEVMPRGLVLGVPVSLGALLGAKGLPLAGRLRAAMDLVHPAASLSGDLSAGRFFRERLGDAWVDQFVEPLLSGIHAGDLDTLSLQAALPHLYQAVHGGRGLIRATQRLVAQRPKVRAGSPGAPAGPFATLRGGLETLVEALRDRVGSTQILRGIAVRSIERVPAHFVVHLEDGRALRADAVVLATPAAAAACMLPSAARVLRALDCVAPVSVANVALAYPRDALPSQARATGFIVPRSVRGHTLTACTWVHMKWPHATPHGQALLRCYVGRSGDEGLVDQDDGVLIERVLEDLRQILHIRAKPLLHCVTRWPQAMPQYAVGHLDRLADVRRTLAEHYPGVYLAGAAFGGSGLPDCVRQGKEAAQAVAQHLSGLNYAMP